MSQALVLLGTAKGPVPLDVPARATIAIRQIVVAVPRRPNVRAGQSMTGTIKKSTGTPLVNGNQRPNKNSAEAMTQRAATKISMAAWGRSRGSGLPAHTKMMGVTTVVPTSSLAHQMNQL